ncbi:MAG: transglycosylase domain-containing protein [Bdellovibrionota bacterium]
MLASLTKKNFLIFSLTLGVTLLSVLFIFTFFNLQPLPDSLEVPSDPLDKVQILDRNGKELSRTYQSRWNVTAQVPLHEMPQFLRDTFVFSEDKRFFQHHGVDWLARFNALWQSLSAGRIVRGASTISEQVVRLLHPRPRTLCSKWLEGIEAYQLERKFSKGDILNFYLNQVPYGRRLRGVAQSAKYYFDRSLTTLSKKEILALAVLVRAPSAWDPKRNLKKLNSVTVLTALKMEEAGLLTPEDLDLLKSEKLLLREASLGVDASHLVQKITQNSTALKNIRDGKLRTTLDSNLQTRLKRVLDEQIKRLQEHDVHDGAILVADIVSNQILVWANSGVFGSEEGSQIDAITTLRQPGSTLKPFVYALALEKGWTAATIIDDAPISEAINGGVHQYQNFSRVYYGPIRLRQALGNSLNTPVVRTTHFVGVEDLLNRLRKLGFASLQERAEFYGDGLALGNGEVTLFELVRAYGVLARMGLYSDLSYLEDPKKQNLKKRQVFSSEVTSIINDILSDPEARRLEFGRYGLLQFQFPVAVKTGTSNDFRDAWALGYNNRFVVGVWMGNLTRQPMRDLSGAVGPVSVVRSAFGELGKIAHFGKLQIDPSLDHVKVCAVTGLLPDQNCPKVTELFVKDTIPTKQCHANHRKKSVTATALDEVEIVYPLPNMKVAMDPRIPDSEEALIFEITPLEGVLSVHWLLNGVEVGVSKKRNGRFFWQVQKGQHVLQAVVDIAGYDGSIFSREVPFLVK